MLFRHSFVILVLTFVIRSEATWFSCLSPARATSCHCSGWAVCSANGVLPSCWFGRLLRERGHRVTMITSVVFDDFVRATGLDFVGIGTHAEFDDILKNPDVWSGVRGPEIILRMAGDSTARQFDAIHAALPDVQSALLIAPGTAFGARLAREKLGIPLINVHLQPVCYVSLFE